jgi:hypothetical protein
MAPGGMSNTGEGPSLVTWHRVQGMQQRCMRIRPTLMVCVFCSLALLSFAQDKSAEGSKVLALEKKWTEAYRLRDINILSSLLAEEFVITVEDGNTYGKAGYITHSADTACAIGGAK